MDLTSFFQIVMRFPGYSQIAELFQQQLRLCLRRPGMDEDELLRRVREYLPTLMDFLKTQRHEYQKQIYEKRCHQRKGHRFVAFGEELYPQGFYLMPDPPLVLSYRGEPAWHGRASLAVVGSREAREESLIWMEKELSVFLRDHPVPIVSGGARGVDQKAHALAIRCDLPTIVVLPSGLGQLYPASLREWQAPVLKAGGCFLSEYPHEQPMRKFFFHHRNRLIAALGTAALIVEARQRSGTLLTAQQAAQWGRPVWVVPGHPQDTHFSGSLNLLSEGATLVRDAQDLSLFFAAETGPPKGQCVSVESDKSREHYP
jgi:DNA processing protein